MQTSSAFSFNKADLEHIARHAGFAAAAAIVGYLLTGVIPNLNVTGASALAMPIIVTLLTTLQSWISNHD